MRLSFKAHFDGKVIVPDEPVTIPSDTPFAVELTVEAPMPPRLSAPDRQRAWTEFFARPSEAPYLSNESLRREYIYDDEH